MMTLSSLSRRGTFNVTTPPASFPITLSEAKAHLKVDYADDDAMINTMIAAATGVAEAITGRALLTQTITQRIPGFPVFSAYNAEQGIRLFRPPLQQLVTVKYYDSDNVLQTLYDANNNPPGTSGLIVDTLSEPALVYRAYGESWPDTASRPDAVELVYTAGWSQASLVPAGIRQGILLIIGEMYERRENHVRALPTAAEYLLNQWRVI